MAVHGIDLDRPKKKPIQPIINRCQKRRNETFEDWIKRRNELDG